MNIRNVFLSIILLFFSMSNSFAMRTGVVEYLRQAINEQNVQQVKEILATQTIPVDELQRLVETVLSINNPDITRIIFETIHNPRKVLHETTGDVQIYNPFDAPPIPLVHQDSACYFNSALQALAVIPGLKEALMPYACCNEVAKLFVEFLDAYHRAYNNPLYTDLFPRINSGETISNIERTRFIANFKEQRLEKIKMELVRAVFNKVPRHISSLVFDSNKSWFSMQDSFVFLDSLFLVATTLSSSLFLNQIDVLLDQYVSKISGNFLSGVQYLGDSFGGGFKHYISIVKRGNLNFLINDLSLFPVYYTEPEMPDFHYVFYTKESSSDISFDEVNAMIQKYLLEKRGQIGIDLNKDGDSFKLIIKGRDYRIEVFLNYLINTIGIDQMIYLLRRTTITNDLGISIKLSEIFNAKYISAILFSLVTRNKTKSVQYLIDNGIDVNISDHLGTPILEYARANGFREMVEILHRNAPTERLGDFDLITAIENSDIDRAKEIIEMVASGRLYSGYIDNTSNGFTALIFAAHKNNTPIIEFLVGSGANIKITAPDGKRALNYLNSSDRNYEYNRRLLMTPSEIKQEQLELQQKHDSALQEQERREQERRERLERYQKQEYDRALREEQEQQELAKKRQERYEQDKQRRIQEQNQRRIQEQRREQQELDRKRSQDRYEREQLEIGRKRRLDLQEQRRIQEQRELDRKRSQDRYEQEREQERIERLPYNRLFSIIMNSGYSLTDNEEYILGSRNFDDLISKMNNDYPSESRFLITLSDLGFAEQREIFELLIKKTKEARINSINRKIRGIGRDRIRLIDFLVEEFAAVFKMSSSQLQRTIRDAYRRRDKSRFFDIIFNHLIEIEKLNNLSLEERREFVKKFRKKIRRN